MADWDQFDQFWGQALRWTLPDPTNQAITAEVSREDAEAVITIDSQTADGDAIDLAGQSIQVTVPGEDSQVLALAASAPGQYEARLADPLPGAYQFTIGENQIAGVVQISPEWLPSSDGSALLADLATRTGGQVLALDVPPDASIWQAPDDARHAPGEIRPLWAYSLIAALLLFVTEIVLRQARSWTGDGSTNRRNAAAYNRE